jgi:N-acetylglucosaminyl-diphospho-decaprenol L-rhamnosyltransferase
VILNREFLNLSVIIVNYNVKFFLEQCLCSVRKAIEAMDSTGIEVFVVDNHSIDGSIDYVQPKFPWVRFIINPENLGFSKANNQALAESVGKYILFLNPDTILPEDSFKKVLAFMDSHPDAGACGVRMVDGRGSFLKESKRGFPSPWASFCKSVGLTAAFPRSRFFAAYYLGHLNEEETNRVDTLSGAFMLVKKELLEAIGGFDEQFFMYGEDIDLSYRIRLSGSHNYYLPNTTIIHFKGESTKKDFRYVQLFYRAMSQFTRKYFRNFRWAFFGVLLESAIGVRGAIAMLVRPFIGKNKVVEIFNDRVFLTGDPMTIEAVSRVLLSQGRKIMLAKEDALEIIFCEGDRFSFSEIIKVIEQLPEKKRYWFHAAGSLSIIGSESKDIQGLALSFPKF